MKKTLCEVCNLLFTNNNIRKHKSICNGKPSIFVRHANGIFVRTPTKSEIFDWKAFQVYYDNNHSLMECCRYFNISTTPVCNAIKKGLIKMRSRTETARLRGNLDNRFHTEESKQKISKSMRKAVLEGRQKTAAPYGEKCKLYEAINSLGEKETLQGGWENRVAEYMSSKNIRWTRSKKSFTYIYKTKEHEYFPDFFLLDYGVYIEVKGMKTDRDEAKWSQFPKELIVIDKTNINNLDILLLSFQ
jgi:hypothetical protein